MRTNGLKDTEVMNAGTDGLTGGGRGRSDVCAISRRDWLYCSIRGVKSTMKLLHIKNNEAVPTQNWAIAEVPYVQGRSLWLRKHGFIVDRYQPYSASGISVLVFQTCPSDKQHQFQPSPHHPTTLLSRMPFHVQSLIFWHAFPYHNLIAMYVEIELFEEVE